MSDYIAPHAIDKLFENIREEVISPPSTMGISSSLWTKGWYYDPGGKNVVCRWCCAVLDFRRGGCFDAVMTEHKQACTFYYPRCKRAQKQQSMGDMLQDVKYMLELLGNRWMQDLITRILRKVSQNSIIDIEEELAHIQAFINNGRQGVEPVMPALGTHAHEHAQNHSQNGISSLPCEDNNFASPNLTNVNGLHMQDISQQAEALNTGARLGSGSNPEFAASEVVPRKDGHGEWIEKSLLHPAQAGSPEMPCISLRSTRTLRETYDAHPEADTFREESDRILEDCGSHPHPRFPEFDLYQERLASFRAWRNHGGSGISPETFAEANFFYSGCRDQVICFHCGCILENWEEGENPTARHRSYLPNCHILRSPQMNQLP